MSDSPLVRKPVPPAAKPATAPRPVPTGPIPPGGAPAHITPETQRQLEAVGWQPGQVIPANLSKKIQQLQARVNQEIAAGPPVPPDHKPPQPRMVDITEWPAHAQEELRQFMAAAQQKAEQQAARDAQEAAIDAEAPTGASPSVAAAYKQARMRELETGPGHTIPGIPTETEGGGKVHTSGILPIFQEQPELPGGQEAAEQPQAPPKQDGIKVAAEAEAHARLCPRCNWDMKMEFDVSPTAKDREVFVAGILAQTRFRKEVELLGGRVKVTFRTLNSSEAEVLYSEMRRLVRDGEVFGDAEYFMTLQGFRLTLGVEKVVIDDEVRGEVPEYDRFEAEPAEAERKSKLKLMQEYLWKTVIPQEPLRRVVAQQHRYFQRLTEALEAQTSVPDFWTGIGSQP